MQRESAMTRNTISVPPLEPRDPHPPRSRRASLDHAHDRHPELDPAITHGAQVGDVPDIANRDVMERDTPVNLYIAIAVTAIVVVLAAILFMAIF